jgi:zinc transport system ATP-binding protein
MDAPARPLLAVQGLTVRRGGGVLLEDVSLVVSPASVHGIIGPNGAGKTTLLAAILGSIEFEGRITFQWRSSGRIGFVPQTMSVDRTLPITVGEFLALTRQRRPVCLGLSRDARERVRALLEDAGLGGFEDRALGALSGGEMQRVLLAHAMDPVPELLLLDEPTSGLDEAATAHFEDRLLALQSTAGVAVLMVSHDLEQVRRTADTVTILQRVVHWTGPVAEVLAG